MSAITGIGESRTIFCSASASSIFGTAQRTISQPAETSAAICAVVASTSCVFVSVIDWTTTGAPPPIVTSPTRICARLPIATSSVETCPPSPLPRTWTLARPPDDHPHDAWGLGADLEPGTLLAAYRAGLFPMRVDGDLVWWSPVAAGGDPASPASSASRSLRRAARGFEIRVDTAFADVIRGCADPRRPHGWIDADVHRRLHAPARARLGALGRGLGRRRARRRALRRRDRRPLRGRVDVPPPHRRLEGGAPRARRAAPGGRRRARCSTSSGRRRTSSRSAPSRSARAEYHRRLDVALGLPDALGEALGEAQPRR